jgi:hypothetical protein
VADPKSKALVAAVVAALEAIPAGQYKPDRVVKCAAFDSRVLDSSLSSVVSLSPDFSTDAALTFGPTLNMVVDYPIDIAVCRKFDGAEDPFNPPSPDRWGEQQEMVRVVKDALRLDRTFGGAAMYSEIPSTDQTAENTFAEGWALSFLRLVVQYRHNEVAS